MKTKEKEQVIEKPFNSQKQLQQHLIDKFVKFGHKVKYNFKIKIRE